MSTNKLRINKTFLKRKRSSIKSKELDKKQLLRPKFGTWDQEEDQLLKQWVKDNGPYNWTKCAEFMKNRTAKQCREHWKNSLDSNLIIGNWTSEEDLLIMKFYKKYESWRKMIPMFENRTENSIKNRFFSQLRKIAIKKRPANRKEYGTKYGLDILKTFLDEGIKQAEEKYYTENKGMTKEGFGKYMVQIENLIKNRKKGQKFIDLKSLKRKNLNVTNNKNEINIDEDKDEEEVKDLSDVEDNFEAFNINKNQKTQKKRKKKTIFKTIINNVEPITRDETINSKYTFQFKRKNSKNKNIIQKETNEPKEIQETEKQKEIKEKNQAKEEEKSKKDTLINNNNIQRLKSKEFNKKKSKENFMTKNEIIEPELVPISHGDFNEYKINLNNINDKSLKRTSSLTYNENEFESDETINRKNSIYKHRANTKDINIFIKGNYNMHNIKSFGQD